MNLFASIYERETQRCSTVYIDNSLGPLARDSPCISTLVRLCGVYFCTLCPSIGPPKEISRQALDRLPLVSLNFNSPCISTVVRLCGVYFCTLCPSIGPKERSRQALDRFPPVSNFLTNFWMQHFDGARLSPNSIRNAVRHALNEPVSQYLRTRNPRCSTVYVDNSLEPLARDSPCMLVHLITDGHNSTGLVATVTQLFS